MESDGILELYDRSKLAGVRYNPFIGDGDSSAYSMVEKTMPYGPLCTVEKRECVNHVTKRMGTNLRNLLRNYKGNIQYLKIFYLCYMIPKLLFPFRCV